MEPILPTPSNLEQQSTSVNQQPMPAMPRPESAPNVSAEMPHEATPATNLTASPSVAQPVVPIATGQSTAQQSLASVPTDDPQIADDVDVIEKEWVDKAKKIVSATKEDPHQQGKEVGKLQADYLMKRYNKQIKLSE